MGNFDARINIMLGTRCGDKKDRLMNEGSYSAKKVGRSVFVYDVMKGGV